MMPLVTSPSAQALAWSLVHFAWQGSAIGLVALACLRLWRLSAEARYGIGVIALGAMMIAPVATFGVLVTRVPAQMPIHSSALTAMPAAMPTAAVGAGDSSQAQPLSPASASGSRRRGTPMGCG